MKRGKLCYLEVSNPTRPWCKMVFHRLGSRDADLEVTAQIGVDGKILRLYSTGCQQSVSEWYFRKRVTEWYHPMTGGRNPGPWEPNYYREYLLAMKKAKKISKGLRDFKKLKEKAKKFKRFKGLY